MLTPVLFVEMYSSHGRTYETLVSGSVDLDTVCVVKQRQWRDGDAVEIILQNGERARLKGKIRDFWPDWEMMA